MPQQICMRLCRRSLGQLQRRRARRRGHPRRRRSSLDDNSLMNMAELGHVAAVRQLLAARADALANIDVPMGSGAHQSRTALCQAAAHGHVEVAKELLEQRSNVETPSGLLLYANRYAAHRTVTKIGKQRSSVKTPTGKDAPARRGRDWPRRSGLVSIFIGILGSANDRQEEKSAIYFTQARARLTYELGRCPWMPAMRRMMGSIRVRHQPGIDHQGGAQGPAQGHQGGAQGQSKRRSPGAPGQDGLARCPRPRLRLSAAPARCGP